MNNKTTDDYLSGYDIRVSLAIKQAMKTDRSFTEKGFLGLPISYNQHECRKFWFDAMAIGMQEGIRIGSLQGQRIDNYNSCKTDKQREFLDKFYKLSEEYNCVINYHPVEGMCIIDLNEQ